MSGNAWVTRDDVLKDLKQVNGRNTGVQYLEQYVVRGEVPPPVRPESTDDDEIQHRFGGAPGTSAEDEFTPDLKGISQMLQMVDELHDPIDSNDYKTIFRNSATDEICISKLNPQVDEFVPGRTLSLKPDPKRETPKKIQIETLSNLSIKGPMLIRKSDKLNGHSSKKESNILNTKELSTTNIEKSLETKDINNSTTEKDAKESPHHSTSSLSVTVLDKVGNISLDKKLDIDEMEYDEIEMMKEKIKSKIINSSEKNSLHHKREKNVAIATLLKLCSAPRISDADQSVKLISPDYFRVPPTPVESNPVQEIEKNIVKERDSDDIHEEGEKIPETSSSASDTAVNQYVDPLVQESISKVNDWFNNKKDKPKPKQQSFNPLKQPIALKKKTSASPSITSTPSSEKKESCTNFVPSSYASELMQKYEANSRKIIPPKEDLGSMLERVLKERDQQIKKKLLEKKEAVAPGSGRSVQ